MHGRQDDPAQRPARRRSRTATASPPVPVPTDTTRVSIGRSQGWDVSATRHSADPAVPSSWLDSAASGLADSVPARGRAGGRADASASYGARPSREERSAITAGRGRSQRRKLAVATWRGPRAGLLYARLEIDATPLLAYAERLSAGSAVPVRPVHVLGRAVALGLREVPAFNARVLLGRVVPHERVDVGFAVDIRNGDDLAPAVLRDADLLPTVRIAELLGEAARTVRTGRDRAFASSNRLVRFAPWWTMRPVLAGVSLWNGGLGRPALGQPGSPLGHAFVSNIGSLGLDEAYLAPLPFARVPLYLALGAVRDRPIVVDGALVVRPTVLLTATADHRVVDGAHAAALVAWFRTVLAEPELLDRPPA